jgi:hypothetical protein
LIFDLALHRPQNGLEDHKDPESAKCAEQRDELEGAPLEPSVEIFLDGLALDGAQDFASAGFLERSAHDWFPFETVPNVTVSLRLAVLNLKFTSLVASVATFAGGPEDPRACH